MTREEAIKDLEYLISGECTDSAMDYVEAIEMAIKALTPRKRESTALEYCVCGTKQKAQIWYGNGKAVCICPVCDLEGERADTEIQARRNWNNMIISKRNETWNNFVGGHSK